MSDRKQANRILMDTARAIAAEQPPAGVETAAVGRVRQAIAAAAAAAGGAPASAVPAEAGGVLAETGDASNATLASCADYQARMPALVAGTLPEAQRLLVEDHARECIPCRKRLQAVRAGRAVSDAPAGPAAPARVGRYYAAAAALVGVAAAGVWLGQRLLLPPQDDLLQVRSVDGRTFLAGSGGGAGLVALALGDTIDGGDRVRTGAGSRAVFELADGSRLEAAGLTAFRVDARRQGHRVRVDQGSMIVQAAAQGNGSLVVSTEEMLVSVKGTIFAVTHGVKGSRVSVIEGEVEVEQGRVRHSLLAGDQLRSRTTLAALTLQEEVGWSQDAERYLALLEEFKALRSELNQLMEAAEPRHSTRLLDLMPADTAAYLAVPNASATLSDLFELVRSRMESSDLLAEWWAEVEASGAVAAADDVVATLREFGDAMGEETVVAFARDETAPLIVTEVTDAAALREAIEAHLGELQAGSDGDPVRIVADLDDLGERDAATGDDGGGLLVWIADDLAAASTSPAVLRAVAANRREDADNPFVGSRLHGRLAERYAEGAEILGAIDLAAILSGELAGDDEAEDDGEGAAQFAFTGLDKVQDLVVSRSQDGDRANLTATVSFDGERSGMVSWLGEPGANGALEFFSPDASFVTAGVIEDPATIWDDLVGFIEERGGEIDAPLAEAEAELGLSLRDEFLEHVGGEYAAGIDGPVLPSPAWKAVAAVYDADALQGSIETLVAKAAEILAEAEGDGLARLVLDEQESGGRTIYRLGFETTEDAENAEADDAAGADGAAGAEDADDVDPEEVLRSLLETREILYTYFDGYMVSASSVAAIDAAIRYRGSGASLVDSQQFLDLLPPNGYADFSAVVYNRLADTASELLGMLPTGAVDDERQGLVQAIEESISSVGPALYTVYAGRSEIVVTSSGPSLLAFSGLGQVLGIGALLEVIGDEDEDEDEDEAGPGADVVAGLAAGEDAGAPGLRAAAADLAVDGAGGGGYLRPAA